MSQCLLIVYDLLRFIINYLTVLHRWVRVGFRKITFKTDLKCKCRECKDIKSFKECVHTYPCPNKHNRYSYCFWKKLSYDHEKPKYPTRYDDKPKYRPTKKPPTHRNRTRSVIHVH